MTSTAFWMRVLFFAVQVFINATQADTAPPSKRNFQSIQQDQVQQFKLIRSTTSNMEHACFSLSRVNHTSALLDCNAIFRGYRSLTRSLVSFVQVEMTNAVATSDCANFVTQSHKAISTSDRISRKSAELHTCIGHNFVSSTFRAQMKEIEENTLRDLQQHLHAISYQESAYKRLNPWSDSAEVEWHMTRVVGTARRCMRQVDEVVRARQLFLQLLAEAGHTHKVFGKQSADTESDWDPSEDDADFGKESVTKSGCSQVHLRSMQSYLNEARSILGLEVR